MPLPVIADTVRASIEGIMPNGHAWANVVHYRKSGALSFTGAIAIADPLLMAVFNANLGGGTKLDNFGAPTWSVERIRHTPLDGTSATSVFAHHQVGLSASEALPGNVALVITFYTALRGRQHRGRMYLSGFAEDANTAGGVLLAAYATQIQTQMNGWLASFTGTGVAPVVAHYSPGSPSAENVTSMILRDAVFDTQRRRQRI